MSTRVSEEKKQDEPATQPNGAGPKGPSLAAFGPATLLDMGDPNFMGEAIDKYNELRDDGRVHVVKFANPSEDKDKKENPRGAFFERESLFVARYDDVVDTLLNDDFSVDMSRFMTPEQKAEANSDENAFRPLMRSLLSLDPPDHTRIRKLVQPSFTGSGMERMRGSIQGIIDRLLDGIEAEAAARGETPGNRRMDLVRQLAYPYPVTVISDMLGIPKEDRERIRGWTENLLRVDRGRDEAMDEQVRSGLRDFTKYLTDLFEEKRKHPTDDMISRMVQAEEDNDVLTEDEMLATVFLMYLAGHVTTVNLVGSGIVAVMTNPEQLAKLRADPSLSKNMVEETLRYWGPVDFVGRRFATKPVDVAGAQVEPGTQMTIGLAGANHDPAKFANPEAYDITRADANRHVAFGRGIHVCLGAPLARIEGQIAFETLIRRYPELRLAVPAEEIAWSGQFLRGFREIPLFF